MTTTSPNAMISAKKTALRRQIKAKLGLLSDSALEEQGRAVASQVFKLKEVQEAQHIALYLHMPARELPTTSILSQCFDQKKNVYVPTVYGSKSNEMAMCQVDSLNDINTFPKSAWGIPEPPVTSEEVDTNVQVVCVPGVAFDTSNGNRLGHGKGYYDCYLSRLRQACLKKNLPMPTTVGLALLPQIITTPGDLPTDAHDINLDFIVTAENIFRFTA